MTQDKDAFRVSRYEIEDHRSIFLFNSGGVVFRTEVAEIVLGEFPIDAWYPLLLEIPEGSSKKCISGRFLGPCVSRVEWDESRVINLPIYENTKRYQREALRSVEASKDFRYAVPDVTVAKRIGGYYCEQSRAQTVSVLPVWADGTSMLLELDWYEGTSEDCSNPEWHLQASPRVFLEDGVNRLRKICRNRPAWQDCSFYVYVIPPFLGSNLLGQGNENSNKVWQKEWRYSKHGDMLSALGKLMATIGELRIGDTN